MDDSERTFRAAEWLASLELCLESEAVVLLGGAWLEWMSDPRNAAAYDAIAAWLPVLKAVAARVPLPSDAECASDTYDGSISVAEWLRTATPQSPSAAKSVNESAPSSAASLDGGQDTTLK